jgi:predicted DNA-binding protein
MKDEKITFRLLPEEKEKLKLMAEKNGITLSELIR